jgi:hypothetical protein
MSLSFGKRNLHLAFVKTRSNHSQNSIPARFVGGDAHDAVSKGVAYGYVHELRHQMQSVGTYLVHDPLSRWKIRNHHLDRREYKSYKIYPVNCMVAVWQTHVTGILF